MGWNDTVWAAKYPRLATLHDWWPAGGAAACASDPNCGPAPFGNAIVTNIFVNVSTLMTYPPPSSGFPASKFNITNNLVNQDPHFAASDPRGDLNFQLAPDSPAYAMGFQRIPMECFGPWQRCPGEVDWGAAWRAVLA